MTSVTWLAGAGAQECKLLSFGLHKRARSASWLSRSLFRQHPLLPESRRAGQTTSRLSESDCIAPRACPIPAPCSAPVTPGLGECAPQRSSQGPPHRPPPQQDQHTLPV